MTKDESFKQKLWRAADKLRNNMDAAEYKHVVLGLIFLKYISDSFEEKRQMILNEPKESYGDPEDPEEYQAENIFFVPEKSRWSYIQNNAKTPEIGKIVDNAMDELERENTSLRGVLPKNYSRPALDKRSLGELIDLIGSIPFYDKENKSRDVLGEVYEYFLGQFADAEGKKGGQFYTPKSIVQTLVEMIEPYRGRVYDPCCGSGGMFVQSEKFLEQNQGRLDDLSLFGQESNSTTWKLCKMNLAIRQIDNQNILLGNSFHNDQHPDLRADFILANPPFNDSDWGGEHLQDDKRWKYGVPPTGNANFAWVQHFIYHLSEKGIAGFVLANGSMSSNTSNEGEIRKNIVNDDLVDCIVALPGQLFYNTQIPCCLWFLAKDKSNHGKRERKGEVLFIDARNMGEMISRRQKQLTNDEIKEIADTYHAWRGEEILDEKNKPIEYKDTAGFCKSATLKDIEKNDFILTPGRYVGIPEEEEDPEEFEEKMKRLTSELSNQMKEEKRLDDEIKSNLEKIGWKI